MHQDDYRRYAIYMVPASGPLARKAAAWLGWDIAAGRAVPRPDPSSLGSAGTDLAEVTRAPSRYGFHGTIKPPFRLRDGVTAHDLEAASARLLHANAPIALPELRLARIGRFLALVPARPCPELSALAERVVRGLDGFRAPLTPEDRARRRPERLSPRQLTLLDTWGYPYVCEEFRFHLTLTGPLATEELDRLEDMLAAYLSSEALAPQWVDALCLCGERPDGRFEVIARQSLGATGPRSGATSGDDRQ